MEDLRNQPEGYWRERLTPEQYHILRERGTEPAFTGAFYDQEDDGTYRCGACGEALFSSETKYDSGSGWPSFWDALEAEKVELREDTSHGLRRTEVLCQNCGSHLGHLFMDGPKPTGCRYCLNSAALSFDPKTFQKPSDG